MSGKAFLDTSVLVYCWDEDVPANQKWDGLIVQAALNASCTRLLTEDLQDGQRIGGLEIENPFRGL